MCHWTTVCAGTPPLIRLVLRLSDQFPLQGKRCIIRDNCVIEDHTILAPDAVVAPFSYVAGQPGQFIHEFHITWTFVAGEVCRAELDDLFPGK